MAHQVSFSISPIIRDIFIRSISEAVGDLIKEDVKRNRLRTHNGNGGRIWDFLNTELCDGFNSPDCMAYVTQRGPWEMVMVYERESKRLFTVMRETRFATIRKETYSRRRMHYLDMFTRHLNNDLTAPIGQTAMFKKEFADQDDLHELVSRLLRDLQRDGVVIERHVLILFESQNYQLTSVRAVMLDSNLDIVAEENWSNKISARDSVIADTVDTPNDPANDPSRGLRLTSKAVARKKEKLRLKKRDAKQAQKPNN